MSNFFYKIPLREFVIAQKGIKPAVLKKKSFEGAVPYLDISVLRGGEIKEYSYKELGNLATEKDILVVWDGAAFGMAFKGKNGLVGSTLMALSYVGLEQDYLYYFLKSKYEFINLNPIGAGIPHVKPDLFFDLEVPYISITQQKEVLNKFHKALNENARILEQQKDLLRKTLSATNIAYQEDEDMAKSIQNFRQAVLQRAVSGELTEEWREKNAINNINQNNLPNEWLLTSISNVYKVNPTFDINVSDETLVSFLPMAAINEEIGTIDLSISKEYKEVKKGYTRFIEGDLLFAKITPSMQNGKYAIAKGLKNGIGCGTTEFHIFRETGKSLNIFLRLFLLQKSVRELAVDSFIGSTGFQRVPTSFFDLNIFPLPPIAEQTEIVRQVELLFAIADKVQVNYETAMDNFNKLEKSILQQAFSGELVTAEPQTENLESLLEKIRIEKEKLEKEKKEYLKSTSKQRTDMKNKIKNVSKLDIAEVLKQENTPMSATEIWEASKYKGNIDAFYADLKNKNADKTITWELVNKDSEKPESMISLNN